MGQGRRKTADFRVRVPPAAARSEARAALFDRRRSASAGDRRRVSFGMIPFAARMIHGQKHGQAADAIDAKRWIDAALRTIGKRSAEPLCRRSASAGDRQRVSAKPIPFAQRARAGLAAQGYPHWGYPCGWRPAGTDSKSGGRSAPSPCGPWAFAHLVHGDHGAGCATGAGAEPKPLILLPLGKVKNSLIRGGVPRFCALARLGGVSVCPDMARLGIQANAEGGRRLGRSGCG